MLVQFLIDQNAFKNYSCPNLNGRYKARLCGISYHDDLAAGQFRVLRIQSPNIHCYQGGDYANSILFTRGSDGFVEFSSPDFILEAGTNVAFEMKAVAGGAIGNTTWCLLTLDVDPIEA